MLVLNFGNCILGYSFHANCSIPLKRAIWMWGGKAYKCAFEVVGHISNLTRDKGKACRFVQLAKYVLI